MRLFELAAKKSNIISKSDTAIPTDIKAYIEQNCSDFLKIVNLTGHILYRGVNTDKPSVYIAESPINRSPIDTDNSIQYAIDQKLEK